MLRPAARLPALARPALGLPLPTGRHPLVPPPPRKVVIAAPRNCASGTRDIYHYESLWEICFGPG
jgi:hypothetical protein